MAVREEDVGICFGSLDQEKDHQLTKNIHKKEREMRVNLSEDPVSQQINVIGVYFPDEVLGLLIGRMT